MMYREIMSDLFKDNISKIQKPKPEDYRKKWLLSDIGGKGYIRKKRKLSSTEEDSIQQGTTRKEDVIKAKKKLNYDWIDWKLQIHKNKAIIGWSKESQPEENPLYASLFKFYLKNKNESCNWFGHYKMNPIDIY